MHGRLKVKTTAAQAAAKEKERETKKQKYQTTKNEMMEMRKSKIYDQQALEINTNLILVNPDSSTIWNYRREILNYMKGEKNEKYEETLTKELYVIQTCLLNNPKSYGTWHHRGWILQQLETPSWKEELELCDKYLKLDSRNFHCWDHRRVVVQLSNHSFEKELEFTQTLIDANISNYSAWHYRSRLLPVVHPPSETGSLPIDEKIFLKELEQVVSAIFTDPSDQSPWFFLRWLLRGNSNQPKLFQVGGFETDGKYNLALVMSRPTSLSQLKDIVVIENYKIDDFKSLHDEGRIWVLLLPELSDLTVNIHYGGSTVTCSIIYNNQLEPPKLLSHSEELKVGDLSWEALRTIREKCLLLEEIEPNNKWVVLSLVDFSKVIDLEKYSTDVTGYLDILQKIDPLRKNYYVDARNKIIMEGAIRSYLQKKDGCFCLGKQNATKICDPQLLAFSTNIDLSGNFLGSCEWAKYLLRVRNMTLDDNPIVDYNPLRWLDLKTLSLINCGVGSEAQITTVKHLALGVEL